MNDMKKQDIESIMAALAKLPPETVRYIAGMASMALLLEEAETKQPA